MDEFWIANQWPIECVKFKSVSFFGIAPEK